MNLHLEAAQAARFARLALDCLTREYPNKIAHVLHSDADARPPRLLTPAFHGCYDWHSAVHGHWLLARVARLFPGEPFAAEARAAISRNITTANIQAEVLYMSGADRGSFERPYGLAWLLALAEELRLLDWQLAATLAPLEAVAVEHLAHWLAKLPFPDRSGQHANTAFALRLAFDSTRQLDFKRLIRDRAREFYRGDRNAPLAFEPSGEDFLSPSLAEADLMRRVLRREEFEPWLRDFLPDLSTLRPVVSPDPSDGKFAHLDGLNLSRAWMLAAIGEVELAQLHAEAGLAAVTDEHYSGAHWLGTFAVYLLTR
jgi:hypothetical protein